MSLPPLAGEGQGEGWRNPINAIFFTGGWAISATPTFISQLILLCHKRSLELIQLQCGQKPSSPTSATLKCKRNEVIESGT